MKNTQRLDIGTAILLALGLQFAAADRAWSAPPKGSIVFTEERTINDPEKPNTEKTEFIDIGKITDVIIDPHESWVLDLKLTSGETRYLVFYEYDARNKSTILADGWGHIATAPERAAIFKNAITTEQGNFQIVQQDTFADWIRRGSWNSSLDEWQSDKTGRIYIPSDSAHFKDYSTNSWMSLNEYIETAIKADAQKAKAMKSSLSFPARPVLQNLQRFVGAAVATDVSGQ